MRRSRLLTAGFVLAFLGIPAFAGKPPKGDPPPPFVPAIVYVQSGLSGSDLMLMNDDGSQVQRLLEGAGFRHGSPSFSPDGSRIVFRSSIDGPGLYVISTDGAADPVKVIALNGDHGWSVPAWSPDGRFILFSDRSENRSYGTDDWDLYLLELSPQGASAGVSRLTNTSDWIEYQPAWSRDGSRFVARVWIDGNEEQLFIFNLDRVAKQITTSESLTASVGKMFFGPWRPQWNKTSTLPDAIIFSARRPVDTTQYDLWYVEADSRRIGPLLQLPSNYEGSPSWSPDDTRLAFKNQSSTGGKANDISILRNARDLFLGAASSPDIRRTVAKPGGKITDVYEADWKPLP